MSASAEGLLADERRLGLVQQLTVLVLVTLPFTQALTIDLRFPLKIYEVALVAAVAVLVLSRERRRKLTWQLNRWETAALAAFFVIIALSLHVNVLVRESPSNSDIYRFSPYLDGLSHLAYVALAVATLTLVAHLTRHHPGLAVRWWLVGALMASTYSLYLASASLLNITVPSLPGTVPQVANVGTVPVVRSGTFLEGNFLGLYLLVSLVIALATRRQATAFVITLASLTTLSTTNFLAVLGVWGIAVGAEVVTRRFDRRTLTAGVALVGVLVALPTTYYQVAVGEKLAAFLPGDEPTTAPVQPNRPARKPPVQITRSPDANESQSSAERVALIVAALDMTADHPVLGVGAGQFGAWFSRYRPDWLDEDFLNRTDERYIPNNVYAAILSEAGVLGALAVGSFLVSLVVRAIRSRSVLVVAGLFFLFVSLNAYPSYIVAFLWAAFGLVVAEPWRPADTVSVAESELEPVSAAI